MPQHHSVYSQYRNRLTNLSVEIIKQKKMCALSSASLENVDATKCKCIIFRIRKSRKTLGIFNYFTLVPISTLYIKCMTQPHCFGRAYVYAHTIFRTTLLFTTVADVVVASCFQFFFFYFIFISVVNKIHRFISKTREEINTILRMSVQVSYASQFFQKRKKEKE